MSARASSGPPRVAFASRSDHVAPHLRDALARRLPVVGQISPDLPPLQRGLVAARTLRLDRAAWGERYMKSPLAHRWRSRNAARQYARLAGDADLVLQVHGLFSVPGAPTVMYIDCTQRQAAEHWPLWSPWTGRQLEAWYAAERQAYRAALHVFAFCDAARESLVRDYGVEEDRVTVVGGGLSLPAVPPVPPPAPRPEVLFVGDDFVRKGGPVLLEAFRRVRELVPDARLTLVGDRPDVAESPDVRVLGHVADRAELARLYSDAAVFTLPSVFEPFGEVVVEAMAFALPVVASTACGAAELVRSSEAGLLVAPGDAAGLADALVRLLRDREAARRMGVAGRTLVEAELTWDAVAGRMVDVMTEVAARSAPGRRPGGGHGAEALRDPHATGPVYSSAARPRVVRVREEPGPHSLSPTEV